MANENETGKMKTLWTPELSIQRFKEIVTAILGLLILACTLYMAILTFGYAGDQTKITDAKDILQVLLAVAGVVVGYYFGRIPADARATQAQEQANAATAQTEEVNAQAQVITDKVEQLRDKIKPAVGADRSIVAEPIDNDIADDLQNIRDNLRALITVSRKRR